MIIRPAVLKTTTAVLAVCVAAFASAADHLDAPLVANDGRLDINDLYAFQSPTNPDNTVLIMTVNPFAGVMSPTTFNSQAQYQFLIDNDGDAMSDVSFTASFFDVPNSMEQDIIVSRQDNSILAAGPTGANIAIGGGGMLKAGLFDDPFFFDLNGFRNGLNFTGSDAFEGANVSAIVLEIPSVELGGSNVGIWASTVEGGNQFDRMGRPAINTVLVPTGRKDEFNAITPDQDPAVFGDDVRAAIFGLNGDATQAAALTDILLPDVLTFDTTSSDGFLNGRQLADDVIDAELSLLTDGAVAGDGVDMNDVDFLNVFPYLAPQNVVPEPSALVLAAFGLPAAFFLRRRRRNAA